MIRVAGVEPGRMHEVVSDNPARGKAQGRIVSRGNDNRGRGPQTGAKPRSRTPQTPDPFAYFWFYRDANSGECDHPDEN